MCPLCLGCLSGIRVWVIYFSSSASSPALHRPVSSLSALTKRSVCLRWWCGGVGLCRWKTNIDLRIVKVYCVSAMKKMFIPSRLRVENYCSIARLFVRVHSVGCIGSVLIVYKLNFLSASVIYLLPGRQEHQSGAICHWERCQSIVSLFCLFKSIHYIAEQITTATLLLWFLRYNITILLWVICQLLL